MAGSPRCSRHRQTQFPVPTHVVALAAPHRLGTKGRAAGLGQAGALGGAAPAVSAGNFIPEIKG